MILTSVCANYIALSLSPGLHCTTGPRSPNLLLNQVVTLAAPGIRGPPPITGGLGPKLVSTRICWSGASKATDSATAAPPPLHDCTLMLSPACAQFHPANHHHGAAAHRHPRQQFTRHLLSLISGHFLSQHSCPTGLTVWRF